LSADVHSAAFAGPVQAFFGRLLGHCAILHADFEMDSPIDKKHSAATITRLIPENH
jgi:hypothetical protein